MAGRFVYWMNVSLDLRIEQELDEQGAGDWMRIGPALHAEFNARAKELVMMVQGRRIHETMESFWPAAAADESLPGFLREYGRIWTEKPKVLVSRTRVSADHNTRIMGGSGDAIAELAELRSRTEGAIGVGGATLATQLLHAGLLDELMLFTHPVVLGRGRPLFDSQDAPVQLDLIEQQTYEAGVTLHRYAVRPVPPTGFEPVLERV